MDPFFQWCIWFSGGGIKKSMGKSDPPQVSFWPREDNAGVLPLGILGLDTVFYVETVFLYQWVTSFNVLVWMTLWIWFSLTHWSGFSLTLMGWWWALICNAAGKWRGALWRWDRLPSLGSKGVAETGLGQGFQEGFGSGFAICFGVSLRQGEQSKPLND